MAKVFLYGRLRADVLQRHCLLNRENRALSEGVAQEFALLVDACNQRFDDVASSYRALMASEMVDAVELGLVENGIVAKNPSAMSAVAKAIVRQSGVDLAEAKRIAEAEVTYAGMGGEDVVVHKGRAFPQSAFSSLPKTDRSFDSVRFLAFDNLLAVIGFLESRGYTWFDADLSNAVAELHQMTGPTYRGVLVPR